MWAAASQLFWAPPCIFSSSGRSTPKQEEQDGKGKGWYESPEMESPETVKR
jgi:hypothetical protein